MILNKSMIRLLLPIAVVFTPSTALLADDFSKLPISEYTGNYTISNDGSWFIPNDSKPDAEPMWTTFTGKSSKQVDSLKSSGKLVNGKSYILRCKASITTSGMVGPKTAGKPALLVRDIIEIKEAQGNQSK